MASLTDDQAAFVERVRANMGPTAASGQTRSAVRAALDLDPTLTNERLAEAVGCSERTARTVRAKLGLPRNKPGRKAAP